MFKVEPIPQKPIDADLDGFLRAQQQQRCHQQAGDQMEMGIEMEGDPPVEGDGKEGFGNRQDRNPSRGAGFRRRPPDKAFPILHHACLSFEIHRGSAQDTRLVREPLGKRSVWSVCPRGNPELFGLVRRV